jgi:hypothetical protein
LPDPTPQRGGRHGGILATGRILYGCSPLIHGTGNLGHRSQVKLLDRLIPAHDKRR